MLDPNIILSGKPPEYESTGAADMRALSLKKAVLANQQGAQDLQTGAQTQQLNQMKLQQGQQALSDDAATRAIYKNPANYDTNPDGSIKPNSGKLLSDLYQGGQFNQAAALTQSMLAQQKEAVAQQVEVSKLNALHAGQFGSIAGSIKDEPTFHAGINQALQAGLISPGEAQTYHAMPWNASTQSQMQQLANRAMTAQEQHEAAVKDPLTAAQTTEALTNVDKNRQVLADTWNSKVLNAASSATDQASLDGIRANFKAQGAPDSALAQIPAMYSQSAMNQMGRQTMTAEQRGMLDARLAEIKKLNTPAELAAVASDQTRTPEERSVANQALERLNAYQKAGRAVNNTNVTSLTPEAMQMLAGQVAAGKPLPYLGRDSGEINKQVFNAVAASNPGIDLASADARFKADSGSLAQYTKTLDNISGFERGALANLKMFTDAAAKIPDTGIPWLNTPVRLLSQQMVGSENMAAVNAARQIGLREIARITNDPKMSGILSDSARREVMDFSPKDATLPQIRAVAKIVQQDVANVHAGVQAQKIEIEKRIGKGNAVTPAPVSNATYTHTATGANGHKIGTNDGKNWFDVATGAGIK